MTPDEKLDAVHEGMLEMRPLLPLIRTQLEKLDDRQRSSETLLAKHDVKIERLQDDVDGLGRKVRKQGEQLIRTPGGPKDGAWVSLVAGASALFEYWHWIVTIGFGVLGLAGAVWKLH